MGNCYYNYCSGEIVKKELFSALYCRLEIKPLLLGKQRARRISFLPGQFLLVYCFPYTYLPRPFAIYDVLWDGSLVINFKIMGPGTKYLSSLLVGDKVKILYPLGNGYLEGHKDENEIIFISGGTGAFSLAPLYRKYKSVGKAVKFYVGIKNRIEYLLYKKILRDIPLSGCIISTEDGSVGARGKVSDVVVRHEMKDIRNKYFYIAGPIGMVKDILRKSMGEVDGEVSVENIISCGVGACRGCVLPTIYGYRTICRDGPVFRIKDILWDEIII